MGEAQDDEELKRLGRAGRNRDGQRSPGSQEERLRRIAAEVANLLEVPSYTIRFADLDGPPGTAYTEPLTAQIEISTRGIEHLSDTEIQALLGHELGHLKLPEPRWAHRRRIGLLAISAGATTAGAAFGWSLTADSLVTQAFVALASAIVALFIARLSEQLTYSRSLRRYELACDAEAAHHLGTIGFSLLRFDPIGSLPRTERLFASHPSTPRRRKTIALHAFYARCECSPRAL
ncbi:M48 family metalloprotease [Plantibacter sp. MMLR14_011]|uniref:M48 family metalloprotease n=1 Tax=Plantibacter sp. MMLR14_011 TaxID=1898746 RepID=UPI00158787A9|nr:M48 family metalloprotease [Plantibacter sp. MMLR14_011]